MTDFMTKSQRSNLMSKIRSKNTKPELLLRKYLFSKGLRYILHDKRLPGSPDVVFPRYKTVIQVKGCFWHHHPRCKYSYTPKTNSNFWRNKFKSNRVRDKKNNQKLRRLEWKVINIWECQIMDKKKFNQVTKKTFMKIVVNS